MKKLSEIKITLSTRFWFSVIAFFVNIIVFTIGITHGSEPVALGTGLALINAPVFGYIFGRTIRPAASPQPEPTNKD